MKRLGKTILTFDRGRDAGEPPRLGRIHRDGSITFRGRTYPTIRDLPADCLGLLPDLETFSEWKRLYRAIDPRPRRARRPRWLSEADRRPGGRRS